MKKRSKFFLIIGPELFFQYWPGCPNDSNSVLLYRQTPLNAGLGIYTWVSTQLDRINVGFFWSPKICISTEFIILPGMLDFLKLKTTKSINKSRKDGWGQAPSSNFYPINLLVMKTRKLKNSRFKEPLTPNGWVSQFGWGCHCTSFKQTGCWVLILNYFSALVFQFKHKNFDLCNISLFSKMKE